MAHVDDSSVLVDFNGFNFHARHLRGRWVGSMSADRDQADISMALSLRFVVAFDSS